MTKTSQVEMEKFNRFMEAMARILGISRKKLDKMMFQGQESPRIRRQNLQRKRMSSKLAAT